jgi:hypothetical protein
MGKMQTNIKMIVDEDQSKKVQEIAFANGYSWANRGNPSKKTYSTEKPYLYIADCEYLSAGSVIESFEDDVSEEVDADLFIRTNGTCEESTDQETISELKEAIIQAQEVIKKSESLITQIETKPKEEYTVENNSRKQEPEMSIGISKEEAKNRVWEAHMSVDNIRKALDEEIDKIYDSIEPKNVVAIGTGEIGQCDSDAVVIITDDYKSFGVCEDNKEYIFIVQEPLKNGTT